MLFLKVHIIIRDIINCDKHKSRATASSLPDISFGILFQGVEPLVFSETLGNNSFLDLSHAQLNAEIVIANIVRTAGTSVSQPLDQVEDPAGGVETPSARAQITIQTLLAGLDKSQRLIDIILSGLVAETQSRQGLGQTDNTEQSTGSCVGELLALLLSTLLLVSHADICLDHVL